MVVVTARQLAPAEAKYARKLRKCWVSSETFFLPIKSKNVMKFKKK
jgi:hypothetical protein